jgi:hypothetical protein
MSVTISGDTGVSAVRDGVIVQADLATAILPLGVGQTWQNMTGVGGRALGATITNTTGRSIQVSVRCGSSANSSNQVGLTIDSILVATATTSESNGVAYGGSAQTLTGVVPAGSTYGIANTAGTSTIIAWMELR